MLKSKISDIFMSFKIVKRPRFRNGVYSYRVGGTNEYIRLTTDDVNQDKLEYEFISNIMRGVN